MRHRLSAALVDLIKTVAACNAGENAVDRYCGIPLCRETRNDVRRVQTLYSKTRLRVR